VKGGSVIQCAAFGPTVSVEIVLEDAPWSTEGVTRKLVGKIKKLETLKRGTFERQRGFVDGKRRNRRGSWEVL